MHMRQLVVLALLVKCALGLTFPGWAPETPLRGTENSFAGLSVALSSKYAVTGVPEGRVYGYVTFCAQIETAILFTKRICD
jgi:hypothetical protein